MLWRYNGHVRYFQDGIVCAQRRILRWRGVKFPIILGKLKRARACGAVRQVFEFVVRKGGGLAEGSTIPEPATMALTAIGIAALAWRTSAESDAIENNWGRVISSLICASPGHC